MAELGVKYGLDVQEAALNVGALPEGDGWGVEPEDLWGTIHTEYKGVRIVGKLESEPGDYRDYFINLRDVIWGEAQPAVTPEEARDVIQIIELALQSSRESKTIALPTAH